MKDGWTYNPSMFGGGNYVKHFDGFAVSYNPDTTKLGTFMAGDDDGEETALLHKGQYFILNGDFRERYEELAEKGGWDACFEFFQKQNNVSSWSNGTPKAAE